MELIFWIASGLVVYGYIIYPLVLTLYKPNMPDSPSSSRQKAPSVSLLVCAHNDEKVIGARMENLLALDYPKDKIEIVVASDGSTDGTESIVHKYSARGIKLFRAKTRVGKVNVINKVVPRLRGEIIIVSDAGTTYKKDAAKSLVRNLTDATIGCACSGTATEAVDREDAYMQYQQFLKGDDGVREPAPEANGSIYALRKDLFFTMQSTTTADDFLMPSKLLHNIMRPVFRSRREPPSVSLLVCAYNEEKVIAARVENLLALDYPRDKIEIVIGSDGSTDNTDAIVNRYRDKGIKLFRIEGRVGKVNVINEVVPKLRGDIIILSDANTMYKKDAAKKLVRNFEDKTIGCVCGELKVYGDATTESGNMEGAYWRYEQFLKRSEGSRGSLLGANGGIYALRKDLFSRLPSNTIVEDFVLPMKILEKGYRVVYEPEAIAYEETSKKIAQEMERRIRIGAGDFQALFLTWKMLNPLRGFIAVSYFSHKVVRWFAPFLLIMAFALNACLVNHILYCALFLAQCVFYAAALAGKIFSELHVKVKLFAIPYYFVLMNVALFLGFIRFCTRSQNVAWQRTERS